MSRTRSKIAKKWSERLRSDHRWTKDHMPTETAKPNPMATETAMLEDKNKAVLRTGRVLTLPANYKEMIASKKPRLNP